MHAQVLQPNLQYVVVRFNSLFEMLGEGERHGAEAVIYGFNSLFEMLGYVGVAAL